MGLITSVNPSLVPKNAASDLLNVETWDGSVKFRYGYRKIANTQSGFTNARGFYPLGGYSSVYANQDEYVSFEKVSGNVRAYSVNPSTWARTEIKNVSTSVNLHDSLWRAVYSTDTAYFYNPSATSQLYSHDIGDATNLIAISDIAAPTVRPGWAYKANEQIDLTGLDPSSTGEVAVTGKAYSTGSTLSGTSNVQMRHSNGKGAASFEIIFSGTAAGNRDWYWNDAFEIIIVEENRSYAEILPSSIAVTLTNSDSSPVAIAGTVLAYRDNGGYVCVRVWWNRGKIRSDWGNGTGTGKTAKLKVSYELIKNSASTGSLNTEVNFLFTRLGWTETLPVNESYQKNGVLKVAYSYYDTTTGFESALSPILEIPYGHLGLPSGDLNAGSFLVGQRIKFTFASTSYADKTRLYVKDANETWRRIAEVNDTSSPYDSYYLPYDDLLALTSYTPTVFDATRKIVAAGVFRGSVVWGYKGGYQNIKYSRVLNALAQKADSDSNDDYDRGNTFSMAENYDDEPVFIHGIANALIMLGSKGAYVQYGDKPYNMSPSIRIVGSYGCAGYLAACPWKDDSNNQVVAYLTPQGDIYAAGENGIFELSAPIRGTLYSFLASEQALSLADALMFADEAENSLWVVLGKRAASLRKPSIIDGKRYFTLYEFHDTIAYAASDPKRRIKAIGADGALYEYEWDSSESAYIEGTLRDAGAQAPTGFWQSKEFGQGSTRIRFMRVYREGLNAMQVDIDTDGTVSSYFARDGRYELKAGPKQSGLNHTFKLVMDETCGSVSAFEWEEIPSRSMHGA